MRDYDNDGKVDYVTIVKDLHPYMISRNKDGSMAYDKNAFTQAQAYYKLAQADWLWKQAMDLLDVSNQISKYQKA